MIQAGILRLRNHQHLQKDAYTIKLLRQYFDNDDLTKIVHAH